MVIAGTVIAAGLLPGALVRAHADTTDDAFLQVLADAGIGTNFTDSSKIAVAHSACAGYAAGYSDLEIARDLMARNGMTLEDIGFFLGDAVAAYCPQYTGPQSGTHDVSPKTHLNHAV